MPAPTFFDWLNQARRHRPGQGGGSILYTLPTGTGVGSLPHAITYEAFLTMAPPRLPHKVAQITGAIDRSPGRYRGRASPSLPPLGEPPEDLTEAQKEIWNELSDQFPWLARSDRLLVALAAKIQSEINDPDLPTPVSMFTQMRLLLVSMGGTPVDRTRVQWADDDPEYDPAGEFFN